MKTYPSIDAEIVREPIYAFDKIDGSNSPSCNNEYPYAEPAPDFKCWSCRNGY